MNKSQKKHLASKVLKFVFMRAIEITALSFLAMYLIDRYEGYVLYFLLGSSVAVYLFFVIGLYVDDYHAEHRYDNVRL